MPAYKSKFIDGDDLRLLRNVKGLKKSAVAKALGITQQAYSKVERCKKVSIKKAEQILVLFNCNLSDLKNLKTSNFFYEH